MPPHATPALPKTAPTGAGLTGPSPDKMTFSAKKRFFEKEIEETVTPAVKPGNFDFPLLIFFRSSFKGYLIFVLQERRFSFLSEDEINKLKQEEGKF